jgi:acetylornithine deacetylase
VTQDRERAEHVLEYLGRHVDGLVQDLQRLVRIPSISGSDGENEIQHQLADDLRRWGLEVDQWQIPLAEALTDARFPGVEVERSQAWGVVARLPGRGDGSSLMFNAHVDVVPVGDLEDWDGHDAFTGRVGGVAVHGRGACDMKGGLVAAMWAIRAVLNTGDPLDGDLTLAAVQGEEDGGLGTFAMLERGWRADACVIPEPTSLDLVPANAGSLTFRLTIKGLATHASRRLDGVSAIEKFIPVLQALRRHEHSRNTAVDPLMARWDPAYPIEVGTIYGGEWASTVPDRLVAEGRYGVALGEDVGTARAAFEHVIAEAAAADPWLSGHPVDVEWWGGQFAPGVTPSESTIVRRLASAHAAVSPHPQACWGAPYGSDLRLMQHIAGIPTLQYGPGDAGLAHAPNEHVPIGEVLTAARALALLALDHCNQSTGGARATSC